MINVQSEMRRSKIQNRIFCGLFRVCLCTSGFNVCEILLLRRTNTIRKMSEYYFTSRKVQNSNMAYAILSLNGMW